MKCHSFLLFTVFLGGNVGLDDDIPVCTSAVCQRVGHEVVSAMDFTVDPCDDFFEYACRKWKESHPLKPGQDTIDQYVILKERIANQLQDLFQHAAAQNPTEQKALDIYKQCTQQKPDDRPGGKVLLEILNELLGGWSVLGKDQNISSIQLDKILGRLQQNNIEAFADFHVDENIASSDQNILYMRPTRKHIALYVKFSKDRNGTVEKELLRMKAVVQRLLDNSTAQLRIENVTDRLRDIVELEANFSLGIGGRQDPDNRLTFADFSKPPHQSKFFKQLVNMFNTILNSSSVIFTATQTTTVVPYMPAYHENMDKKIAELELEGLAGDRKLVDWLWWKAADHYLYRLSPEYSGTIPADDCVKVAEDAMPLTVAMVYIRKHVSSDAVTKIEILQTTVKQGGTTKILVCTGPSKRVCEAKLLLADITEGVRDLVLKASWMDARTQLAGLEKLNNTLHMIAYPYQIWENLTILDELYQKIKVKPTFFETLRTLDRSASWITLNKLSRPNTRDNPFDPSHLTTVNAQMQNDRNFIAISAAMLQEPMFFEHDLDIVNYARLGWMVGHELTHAFDDKGRTFGKDGKPDELWTNATMIHYNKKKQAFIEFYSNISTPVGNVNGKVTLNENIADNGGYRAAYSAYRTFLNRTRSPGFKLPGLEQLSTSRLFWLIAAQTQCSIRTMDSLRKELSIRDHPPFKVRVIGPFSNNEHFSRDYNCSIGSPMNPGVRAW